MSKGCPPPPDHVEPQHDCVCERCGRADLPTAFRWCEDCRGARYDQPWPGQVELFE